MRIIGGFLLLSFALGALIYLYQNNSLFNFSTNPVFEDTSSPAQSYQPVYSSPPPSAPQDSVPLGNRPSVGIASAYGKQIILWSNLPAGERLNITGWRIQGNHGSYWIPPAIEIYEPEQINQPQDIYLGAGETVRIDVSQGPLNLNLRPNKCIGYLAPELAQNCPYFTREEIQHLAGGCQNFIMSLGNCRLPPPNPIVALNDSCAQFISTINYKSCFQKHQNNVDFLSREWRLWGAGEFLDSFHDVVRLYDRGGKLIDQYVY